jgi:hypothetical protein
MGDETNLTEGPNVLMFVVSVILIGASAVIWANGLKFWNGFLAPAAFTSKVFLKSLPMLLKAL